VSDWKAEQLFAKRQLHEEVLGEVVQNPDKISQHSGSGRELQSGQERDGQSPGNVVVSEKERAAAKQRIAKWKADQAAKLEQEKVRFI
jgi:hypothetical protein